MHKQEAHTQVWKLWTSGRNWAVRGDKRAALPFSSFSMCWDACRSNSFLIGVTGQRSHSMWRERRGEKTHFLIANRYLHVSHLHRGEKGRQQRFFFSPLTGRTVEQSDERLEGREHTAALTAWAAWRHAWVRSHVWVWTWAGWMFVLHRVCTCVPRAPPSVDALQDRRCQHRWCCQSFDLLSFLDSCDNRDAADCWVTRIRWRRAGWRNASRQEEGGDEEMREGGARQGKCTDRFDECKAARLFCGPRWTWLSLNVSATSTGCTSSHTRAAQKD